MGSTVPQPQSETALALQYQGHVLKEAAAEHFYQMILFI